MTEQQLTIKNLRTDSVWYDLVLADGTSWEISAGNDAASAIVSQLGVVMQLQKKTGIIEYTKNFNRHQLRVNVDAPKSISDCYIPLASQNDGAFICTLCPCNHWGGSYINLVRLSLIFALDAHTDGGVLLHGALAERDGKGVILAAPGGTGKTTASNRLPAPWRSLCDDTTLVVRDAQGGYWAHPWPTWSRFIDGGEGGEWDVQKAVPLKGIFFLVRALDDRAEKVGQGHAVSLLSECAKQASMSMDRDLSQEEIRNMNTKQFDNLCALEQSVPVHMLHISLNGVFWEEIERTLEECSDHKMQNRKIKRKKNNQV